MSMQSCLRPQTYRIFYTKKVTKVGKTQAISEEFCYKHGDPSRYFNNFKSVVEIIISVKIHYSKLNRYILLIVPL